MVKGVKRHCDSIGSSEFFAVGVESERPRLPHRLILNGVPALALREKGGWGAKQIKIQAGM